MNKDCGLKPETIDQEFKNTSSCSVSKSSIRIAFILEKFPSPTEYFILNEIIGLEKGGFELEILVLRKQERYLDLPELKDLRSAVIYLPKIYYFLPFLIFSLSPVSIFKKKLFSSSTTTSGFLKKFRNSCYSVYFAYKLKSRDIRHIHAHFAFIAVDIAQVLSKLMCVQYSLTAHAQDIYTNVHRIKQIVNDTSFLITCTKFNRDYLNKITDFKLTNKIFTVYHGIAISEWISNSPKKKFEGSVIHILSIARLVEKKGLIYLLKAIQLLVEQGNKVKCTIIGEGPLQKQLENYIKKNEIDNFVHILGIMPQEEAKKHLASSDIFVLPCIVAENGDRDGLPNVILEAMASGIPVISTNVSAIPELIKDLETGILVPGKNGIALANAIIKLKHDPRLYRSIVEKAHDLINKHFIVDFCAEELKRIFLTHLPSIRKNKT